MTLTSDEKVGIGTSTPSSRLHVYESGTSASAIVQCGTSGLGNVARLNLRAGSSPYDFGLYVADNGNGLVFYDYGQSLERMRINGDGYVTKPYQPSFMTTVASGSTMVAGTVVKFTTIQHNIGSHYSTSTGRFTAPIAGRYFFAYNGMGNDTANRIMLRLQLNGSDYIYGSTIATGYADVKGYAILNLSAGDYVNVIAITNYFWQNGNSAEHYFTGCLLY